MQANAEVWNKDTVVDPDTTNDWTQYTRPGGQPSTQNVGRIWTDKSVFKDTYTFTNDNDSGLNGETVGKGDSDFLVSLSALSSTSNLKSTTTSTTPLDIVLVVDTSGSMDNGQGDSMGSITTYDEVYGNNLNGNRTYYVLDDDGEYVAVERYSDRWSGYYWATSRYGTRYTPIQNQWDNDSSHVQFYQRNTQSVNKMQALQNAANAFVDSVAAMNDSIADASKQHRISLVKFSGNESNSIGNDTYRYDGATYNYSQVVLDLSPYTTQNSSTLKNTINRLQGDGATRADYGMHQAQRVLNGDGSLTGAREDAQKVVIFFTDGEPNDFDGWDGYVAAGAINYAYDMKQDGTLIYSIGVFQDADPSDTNGNFNKYMNAVSSNYKDAQCAENNAWWWEEPQYEQTNNFGDLMLGDRTTGAQGEPNPDYYFAATDADELDQVFEDITSSITENAGSGSPIVDNSEEGNTDPGDLTFTDQLGAYMQVTGIDGGGLGNTDVMKLAYGDEIYTSTSKTTAGNVDTYHFEGTVGGNAVYGEANLANLTVTVTHSDDLATGDTVTVTIPASLIPLRNYDVDTDNGTMTVSQAYPVRLFYGVSLKDGVLDVLNDPSSEEYAAIIGSQSSADKTKLDFYSNSFVKDAADGSTTAEFTPNKGNKFYYYTSNTQLFLDEACSQPATRYNSQDQNTLYYKDVYWTLTGNGDEASEVTDGYGTVTRDGSEWANINWGNGYSDQAYVPAHTERTDRPATMTDAKDGNTTGTATNVLNPAWVGGTVQQRLGNNGKLSLDMPGSLEIKKTVDWGNASDQTKEDKNSFTFEVSLTDEGGTALTGSYPYYVNGSDESAGKVSNGGTITITGGQSVEVKGLPAGSQFTVTEQGANKNGFTTTDSTSQDGQQNTENDGVVNGTIAAGTQISVSFTNTYHASDVNLSTNTTLKVKKNLEGRDWRDTDSFEFTIVGFRAPEGVSDMPMPEDRAITIGAGDKDNGYTTSFGDITFKTPGEYRYTIQENSDPEQPIAGINYSDAIYRVTVMVGDNGTGALTIDSVKIERMYNDDGTLVNTENEGEVVQGDTVAFKNIYSADTDTEGIQGKKDYNDTTGGNPFEGGKFNFKLVAQGGFVTGTGNENNLTISADKTPMPDSAQNNTITTSNVGEKFTFPSITFDGNDVGNTYVYKVTEVAGNEDGMTYSNEEHTVMIKVDEVTDADGTHIVATVLGDYADPNNLVFKNTYKPTEAKLTGGSAIHGTKTLTGRDMKDGETFYFQLTQNSGPETILDKAEVVAVNKDNMQSGSADFNFADMTFTKTGTYTFTVNEVADEKGTETANGSGMTYDTNIATVTVTVTDGNKSDNADDHGKLLASVAYSNDKHGDTTDKALFTNTYEASMNYGAEGGIVVTKQLDGRPMTNEEFAFSIAGTDSDTVTADAANAKLTDADKSFKNTGAAANTSITMAKLQKVSFDQSDAGKTYSYIVDETTTDDADALPGVTCDQTQYRVDIQVVDNGDGSMHTLTTVTKIKDASGADVNNEVVIDKANSDTDDAIPTFGFVNKYNPTPAEAGEGTDHAIQVTKTVTGAPSPDGVSYSFTLTATGDNIGNITGLDDKHQLHVSTNGTINAGESQTMDFGKLTFSQKGTYTFTVQEDTPDAADGWIYDTDAKTVTIVVTDVNSEGQYDGKLYIQSVTGSPVEVTNSYKPDPVVVGGDGADQQITVQKSVTGADSTADFQFKIDLVDEDDPKWDNVEAVGDSFSDTISITGGVKQGESKTASFAGIQFNATGEYQFKITEVGAADFNAGDNRNGWTYDEHEAIVTVTVTDENFDGRLDAAVSYDNRNAITDADKAVDNAAAFTNAYTTTPVELTKDAESGIGVQKKVEGAPNTVDFTFNATFNAEASAKKAAEAGMAAGEATGIEGLTDGKLSVTISDDFNTGDTKAADFGTIKLTKPGVYVFDVTEDNAKDKAPNGWKYDTKTYQITVTVTDNGKGQLEASVEGNDPLFTNSYKANSVTLSGDSQLKVTKEVTGAPALSDFEFTLKLIDSDATGVTGIDEHGITKSTSDLKDKTGDEAKQTVEFGELTFTKAGTYKFQVVENTTTNAAGWTYASGDDNAKTITVTVTDDQFSGQLEATTELDGADTNNPTFTNSYKAGSITTGEGDLAKLQVTKTVTGAPATEEFSFELTPAEEYGDKVAGLADGKLESSTTDLKGAEGSRTVVFGDLTFNAEGTYVFNVKETNADPEEGSGWTYDNDHAKQISVVVTDTDFDGKLEATTLVNGADTNNPTFTNSYQPAEVTIGGVADTAITVNKQVTGRDAAEAFEFSLTLKDGQNAAAVFEGKGEDKTAFDGMKVTSADNIKVGDTDTQAFGEITFTEEGDYVFVVDETTTTTAGGWTYDDATYEVTVHVKDDGQGKLYVDGIDGNGPTFVNKYELQPAMFRAAFFRLQGNKVLDGRNWEAGDEFTFTLTPGRGDNVDGSAMADGEVAATMPAKTSDTIKPLTDDGSWVSDNSAQFSFTDDRYPGEDILGSEEDVFTYTKPGTYRYLIRETNPNVSNPGSGIIGVSYDQTVYRLTVEVTDNGDGTMSAKGTYYRVGDENPLPNGSKDVTFTNKYSSNEVDITFNAFKVLEGRNTNMVDDEFQFHMEFAGWMTNDDFDAQSEDWKMDGEVAKEAPAPAPDKGNIIRGDVTFNGMAFTSDNVGYTYRYAITEVGGGQTKDGVTYDDTTHYVTAKVISVQQEDPNNEGTYIEFVRVETSGEAEYDEANDAAPTTGAIFTNTYDAGSTDVDTGTADAQLTKVLTGKAWDGDKFTFKIEAVSNTAGIEVAQQPMPAKTEVTVDEATGKDKNGNDQATFSFGKISYDTPGTYVYKVTEVAGDNPGITYSTNEATITVSVKDNNNGGYSTGVTVANNVFTNKYASELDFAAAGGVEIVKTFKNADMREFSFTVTPKDQASADKLGIDMAGETLTTTAGATIGDDNASHAEITMIDAQTAEKFTQDDADDTYTYTVQETKGTDGSVDYDGTVYTVTITTADDGQGGIKVTTEVSDGAEYNQTYVYDNDKNEDPTVVIPFTNAYKATAELGGNGSTSIKATKTLTNRPMTAGEFKFNVTNVNDPDTVVATGTNAADGTITFGTIDYSIDQMLDDVDNGLATPSVVDGKDTFTYQYTVAEDQASFDKGVTAIADSFSITVTVTDNGDGTLGIAVAYPDGADGLTFRNAYGEGDQGQATMNIAGQKMLDVESGNNAPDIEGKYTFTLTGEDGAPMPAKTTAKNDAAGNVTFGDVTYTMENVFGDTGVQANAADEEASDTATGEEAVDGEATDTAGAANEADVDVQSAQRTKTFTYTVTESGTVDGVDNDAKASKTFTVTVTDNGDGTLSAVSDPAQRAKFSFTNTYSVDPKDSSVTGDGNLTITKELTGRDLAEGEFKVVMTDQNGKEVASGTNDAQGNIDLSAITFTQPGDYTYNLYEAAGDKGGVTYDGTKYLATAHVEDKGNGMLEVTWSVKNAAGEAVDAITIHNTYAAASASVKLGGTKVLDGRELNEGEFTFVLTDQNGNELQKVTNSAQGGFCFDTITYDAAGTYEYTIAEAKGDVAGVTYDEATFAVKVVVTDDGTGQLKVTELTYNGKAELPVFTNSYVEPAQPAAPADEPTDVLPQTGDKTPLALVGVIAAPALAALVVAGVKMRRSSRSHHMR